MFNLILGPQRYDFFLVIGSSAGENAILFGNYVNQDGALAKYRMGHRPVYGTFPRLIYWASAMSSISTRAPLGRSLTANAQRAGNGAVKNSAYTSFMGPKLAISLRKTVPAKP